MGNKVFKFTYSKLAIVQAEVQIIFKVSVNKRIIPNFQLKPMGIKSVQWPQKGTFEG